MNKPLNNTIVTVPDLKLHEPTQKVGSFDLELNKQIQNMTKALRAEGGVGLAANQLGYANRVLITEFDDPDKKDTIPYQVFINPEIVECSDEKSEADEGCLSIPPIELPVERAVKVKIKAQNEQGRKIKMTAKGLLARVLQHETDHLNGILFTDRIREKYLKDFPELKKIKVVFFGSAEFAMPILKGLILLGLNLPLIITETPKPAGRNQDTKQTAVSQVARDFNRRLIETADIKNNVNDIQKINPDLIILADFGQLIPFDILKIPRLGAFNLHPSLLPKYRGATPIPSAILAGEKETGVSLIKMVPEIDKGPVLAQVKVDILTDDTAVDLEKRLSVASLKLLYEVLPKTIENKLKELSQDETQATYTHKFKKEDGEIDWKKSPIEIDRQIRAFYPWPGTYTFLDNKRLIILAAHLQILNLKSQISNLVLDVVQPEGKNPMKFKDFLRGYHGSKPSWFSKIS